MHFLFVAQSVLQVIDRIKKIWVHAFNWSIGITEFFRLLRKENFLFDNDNKYHHHYTIRRIRLPLFSFITYSYRICIHVSTTPPSPPTRWRSTCFALEFDDGCTWRISFIFYFIFFPLVLQTVYPETRSPIIILYIALYMCMITKHNIVYSTCNIQQRVMISSVANFLLDLYGICTTKPVKYLETAKYDIRDFFSLFRF